MSLTLGQHLVHTPKPGGPSYRCEVWLRIAPGKSIRQCWPEGVPLTAASALPWDSCPDWERFVLRQERSRDGVALAPRYFVWREVQKKAREA